MKLSRRHLAAAGALALGAPSLIQSAMAATADETAVREGVEALRKATVDKDKAKLEALFADQLSYSHSDGRVEDKAEEMSNSPNAPTRLWLSELPGSGPRTPMKGTLRQETYIRVYIPVQPAKK